MDHGDHRGLDGLDLTVDPGQVVCLLGPNGAGKSTTVAVLATLRAPTQGSARIAGHDVVQEPVAVRRHLGVALQHTGLDPAMTGREFLVLQGRLHGLGATAAGRAEELLTPPPSCRPKTSPAGWPWPNG